MPKVRILSGFLLLSVVFYFGAVSLVAQAPFNGMFIEEVELPQSYPDIEAQTPGARAYRVFACMSEPFWELQSVFGYDNSALVGPAAFRPLNINPQGGARFFQHMFGGPTSLAINPAFVAAFPSMAYDSFVTIGLLTSTNNSLQVITSPFLPEFWYSDFETNGGGLNFVDPLGTSWNVIVNRSLPIPMGGYTTQNIPTADNQILIGQFTTNGVFTGTLNFQFRRLNADYSVYLPVQSAQAIGIAIDNTPGTMDEPCLIVFLPVGMISFDAYPEMEHVALRWVTETEINNDYFAIERSKDGITFEEIGRMDGAGNTTNRRIYYGIDPEPNEGINYYRLRQTDYNGAFEYTEIKAVSFTGSESEINLYPNPSVGDEVFVSGRTEELKRYRMYSSEGKLLLDRETFGEPFYGIEIESLNLPSGMYHFEFITKDDRTLREKLVVR